MQCHKMLHTMFCQKKGAFISMRQNIRARQKITAIRLIFRFVSASTVKARILITPLRKFLCAAVTPLLKQE